MRLLVALQGESWVRDDVAPADGFTIGWRERATGLVGWLPGGAPEVPPAAHAVQLGQRL